MLSLQNILNTEGREFLENLLNKEVVVTEKGSIEPLIPNMSLKDSEPFFNGQYFPHHLYPFLGKFVFDKVPSTAS